MGNLTEWEINFLKNTMVSIKKDGVLVMINTNDKFIDEVENNEGIYNRKKR